MNKDLLGKWIWNFALDRDCTWKRLIAFKYGIDDPCWGSREARGPFGMGFWKDILKELGWVKENWKFRVRNGTRIHLWTDHWCGPSTLGISFPFLFRIATKKHAIVADVWDSSAGLDSWNPTFIRAFNDWEIFLVENLLFSLHMDSVTPRFSVRPDWRIRTESGVRNHILGLFTSFFFFFSELNLYLWLYKQFL